MEVAWGLLSGHGITSTVEDAIADISSQLNLPQTMQTDFLSIRVMIVSSLTLGTFLMHRIKNVLTNRVLKKWSGLLRIRSCRIARNLGDHGTWLPIRPAVTYVYTLPLPSVAEHRAQPIA